GRIAVMLQHKVYMAARLDMTAYEACHVDQPATVGYCVRRIQAQAVKAKLLQPVQGIFGKKSPDLRLPEVDRRTPRRILIMIEEARRIRTQVIALGAEMVVHHIQKYLHAHAMSRINQQ